jgi:hypothetical protein
MYTGKLPESCYDDAEKDAPPLMAIAHKYQIKPLVEGNEIILSQRYSVGPISPPSPSFSHSPSIVNENCLG